MPQTFYTSQSAVITLGPRLGSGGEGEVYELRGQPELVAKLYHEPLAAEQAEKLQALARLGNERLFKIAAWPVDVLRTNPTGEICGFLMRKIGNAAEVHTLHSPKSRLQKFPEASWAFLIYVAANIARAVATVHEHGFVIGDVNPKNILVTHQATVYLLDCDSFQMTTEGKTYRCTGGFPEYTPPELQGVVFRNIDRQPEHDWFGLGVVIFQLLFLGRHPFSGKFTGAGEMPLQRAIKELRFAYGADAVIRKMQPPPGTLALKAVSEPLVELFRATFLSAEAVVRPRPREWIAPLERLAKSLKQCSLHTGHQYWQELAACPWCEIETRARIRLFNFALNGKRGQSGYLRLDEVWREIEGVAPPDVPRLPNNQALTLAPSAEAKSAARKKQNSYYLAILMSLVSGFAIGMWVGFPFALFLLILSGCIVRKVARIELDAGVQTLWQRPPVDDPLTQQFEQAKQQAEVELRQLAERWKSEASEERFHARLRELESWKVAYESLTFKRTQQLKRLEEQTRAAQLERFLAQFELDKTVLKNFAPAFYENLRLEGIRTAADVTSARLKKTPLVGAGLAQILLNWRNELESEFAFDPQTIPPHLRIKLERKLDETRERLEHDLRGGAFYLNRLKDEIKESQQTLYAPLLGAQAKLAQAEKDCEAVAKRNRVAPLIVLLILSFLAGGFLGWYETIAINPPDFITQPVVVPAPIEPPVTREFEVAMRLYNEGTSLLNQKRFREAVEVYQRAVALDPQLAGAYQEMGQAYYKLGEYERSVEASESALRIATGFLAYNTLGLAQMSLQHWSEAKLAFQDAINSDRAGDWRESYWQARLNWALCVKNLNEAQTEIKKAEAEIKEAETRIKKATGQAIFYGGELEFWIIKRRIDLALLFWLTGDKRESQIQVELLKSKDAAAAAAVQKLLATQTIIPD